MNISRIAVLKGIAWTSGAFGVAQLFRLAASVIVARLLAPELLGIMVILNSLRTGIDLLSDVGVGQSIIQNKSAEDPNFYNTAWTLQVVRGVILWLACCAAAAPLSTVYNTPMLATLLPVAGLYFVLDGLSSTSIFLLQRRMQFAKLNAVGTGLELISAVAHIVLAYISPTIWALIFGALVPLAVKTIGTHFILPDMKQKVFVGWDYARQILSFGKWIFLSSMVYFLSVNFDRLYLGKDAPLAVLGVYGIARAISDMIIAFAIRLCSFVLFPAIAAASGGPREMLRLKIRPLRKRFLVLAAICLSAFAAVADLPIMILYDDRYQAAAWMLPLLTLGVWFSILSQLNETTLLGIGKPLYGAVANCIKLIYLLIGLPLAFGKGGIVGVVAIVAVGDALRYPSILVGQLRERLGFWQQDLALTSLMLLSAGACTWLRWVLGYGSALDLLT